MRPLVIRARANTRMESAKIRNRRMQEKVSLPSIFEEVCYVMTVCVFLKLILCFFKTSHMLIYHFI